MKTAGRAAAAAAAMSDIVEKTLTALPGLFLQNHSAGGPAAAKAAFSSRLGGLVRGITSLTSKHVGARWAGRSGRPEEARVLGGPGLETSLRGSPLRRGSGPARVWVRP